MVRSRLIVLRLPAAMALAALAGLLLGGAVAAALVRPAPKFALVAIDPGHGGIDPGTCYAPAGLEEAAINLDVARRLETALARVGIESVLMRERDEEIPLRERVAKAERLGATLYLSLHVNEFPDPSCFGAQVFFHPGSPESRRLAWLIQDELLVVQPENFREPLAEDFYVLRTPKTPAVLVEMGFLTSPKDRALLADPASRGRIAAALAKAVVRWLQGESSKRKPTYSGY